MSTVPLVAVEPTVAEVPVPLRVVTIVVGDPSLTTTAAARMTKPRAATCEHWVPYAHEPELIARLLGVALETVNAYGVKLMRM